MVGTKSKLQCVYHGLQFSLPSLDFTALSTGIVTLAIVSFLLGKIAILKKILQ